MTGGDIGDVGTGGRITGGAGWDSDIFNGDVPLVLWGEAILGEELPVDELGEDREQPSGVVGEAIEQPSGVVGEAIEQPSGVVGEAMEEPAFEETDTFKPFILSRPFFFIPANRKFYFQSDKLQSC